MSEIGRARELERIEVGLLVEGLLRHCGVDLRDYAPASLARRLRECCRAEGAATISGLQEKVLHNPESRERLLLALCSHRTPLFRDPGFYLAFRSKVVPLLRTYPFVRIWHAGCSTGEEVYSMAILLEEEGLYPRCRLYATDLSQLVVERARSGVLPLAAAPEYTTNYLRAGGRRLLSDYYTAQGGSLHLSAALRRNVVFSEHNLATDGSLNEFHVVLCRNVMIYFNHRLQDRVHELIYESLCVFGVIGLGRKESLRFSPREAFFEVLDGAGRLYRKVS
jgi:chemotaxis protein methyltransferase CheR